MKNKIILLLLAIIFFIPINKIYGDELKFEAKEIIIKQDGNYIEAKNETKIQASNGVEIKSDKFLFFLCTKIGKLNDFFIFPLSIISRTSASRWDTKDGNIIPRPVTGS